MRWDTESWRNDNESKTTCAVYSQFKRGISEEEIYENNYNSVLLYKFRSNTPKLDWRNRFVGGDEGCWVCETAEMEIMEYFFQECGGLREVWEMSGIEEVPICELLLFGVRGGGGHGLLDK